MRTSPGESLPTEANQVVAPAVSKFATYPQSWYLWGSAQQLRTKQPVSKEIAGRRVVAFCTESGRAVILDSRCSHLGADLGLGCVIGEALQCPFHHWEFNARGNCQKIPVTDKIPPWAQQTSYPVVERHGLIFFFNAPEALFPLPFFADCDPDDFISSRPFSVVLDCPWYLVGANAFDQQHFRAAHDRRLVAPPVVDCPGPYSRRATGTFDVCSDSLQDRITRRLAGPQVTLSSTDYCGTMLFTTATFSKTRSYGSVCTEPLADGKTRVNVIVYVPRSKSSLARKLLDPLHAAIRRMFIIKFLSADALRLNGTRYSPYGLIEADRHLADYFTWVAHVSQGQPFEPPRLSVEEVRSHSAATVYMEAP